MEPMSETARTVRGFDEFSWTDTGDGFVWELADAAGVRLAEVTFEEEQGQRWSWYVALPEEWHYANSPNPAGLARSAADARAVCEAVLLATVLRR